MAGTKEGGIKAAKRNKEKYGKDFYQNIGKIGGKLGTTGGFAADKDRAKKAGYLGGKVSKKGYKLLQIEGKYGYYQNNTTGELVKFKII